MVKKVVKSKPREERRANVRQLRLMENPRENRTVSLREIRTMRPEPLYLDDEAIAELHEEYARLNGRLEPRDYTRLENVGRVPPNRLLETIHILNQFLPPELVDEVLEYHEFDDANINMIKDKSKARARANPNLLLRRVG